MKRYSIIRIKLKPNKTQLDKIEACGESCRKLWNHALGIQLNNLKNNFPLMKYNELADKLKEWKHEEKYSFLKNSFGQAQQQVLLQLTKSIFRGLTKGNGVSLPKFKSYFNHHRHFIIPQFIVINKESKKIKIPLIGYIKFLIDKREIPDNINRVVVSKQAKGWYAYLITKKELEIENSGGDKMIGIDMGVANFLTTSDGEFYSLPNNDIKKWQDKLILSQQKLSLRDRIQKNKTGIRRDKMKDRIRRIWYKIRCIKDNYYHHLSKKLSQDNGIIFIENLKIINMTKSAKGTIENPGKNVKAKTGLNRSILHQGWNLFLNKLQYKLLDKKRLLVPVDPKNTSRRCMKCGHVDKSNRISQKIFICQSCGYSDHADINAAKNIMNRGLINASKHVGYFNDLFIQQFKKMNYFE